jgi:cysteine synthase
MVILLSLNSVFVSTFDMVLTVSDEGAMETTRRPAVQEGLLVGTSSGANVHALHRMDDGSKSVVMLLPDRAERCFRTSFL